MPLAFRHRVSCVCRKWRDIFKDEYFWVVRRDLSACETLLLVWSRNLYQSGVWHGFYPASKEWIRLPLMPRDDSCKGSSTFAVCDEKLFVIGGQISSQEIRPIRSSRVTYFDLKQYEWQETSPLNVCRHGCMAAVLHNLLYVFGGLTDGAWLSSAEVYNPVTKTWNFVSSMPSPMCLLGSIVVQGNFFAINTFADYEYWRWKGVVNNPQEDEWTEMPETLNSGWTNHPAEFNGQIFIRRDSRDCKESCVMGYDLSDNTWRLIHGQRAIEFPRYPRKYQPVEPRMGQLLNLDRSLLKIFQYKDDDTLEILIEDMTNGHIASKSFRPCISSGTEKSQLLPPGQRDLDEEPIACETLRL